MKSSDVIQIGQSQIKLGETRDVELKVSETYAGVPVNLLVRVIRSKTKGPTVFLTGAVHGDELNGTGIIREIMLSDLKLEQGSLICVPVVNIFGFENHSRYLPDRRDLNRSFPGSETGSLAMRLAHIIYQEIISQSDFGMDLHTAAVRRTNYPQIRANMDQKEIARIAKAFGCEVIINKERHENSLREAAIKKGCPTILYEAGEVLKLEPRMVQLGVRGVLNVLKVLGMISGKPKEPVYQAVVQERTQWIRSDVGGMLHFHIRPGDIVRKGDKLATCERLFSSDAQPIESPIEGIVIGLKFHFPKSKRRLKKIRLRSIAKHKKIWQPILN